MGLTRSWEEELCPLHPQLLLSISLSFQVFFFFFLRKYSQGNGEVDY